MYDVLRFKGFYPTQPKGSKNISFTLALVKSQVVKWIYRNLGPGGSIFIF